MRLALFAVIALCLACAAANASTTTFTDEASFLAGISTGYYLETFPTFTDGDPLGGDPSPTEYHSPVVNGYSWTATAPQGLWSLQNAISGAYPFDTLTISFAGTSVTAVGGVFAATDYAGEVIDNASVVVALADGTTQTITGRGFVGFTSTARITSLTITPSAADEPNWSAFSKLYVGGAAGPASPEPSSILALMFGLAGMGSTGRIRRFLKR